MEKISLPIKTKIAAWWLIFLGIIGILLSIVGILRGGEIWVIGIFLFLPSVFCSFLPAFLLLLIKNKWAWIFTIIMLLIGIGIIVIGLFFLVFPWEYGDVIIFRIIFSISLFVLLIPFILLLFDYKNLGKGWTTPIKIAAWRVVEKIQFPIKTIIAALWIIVISGLMIFLPLWWVFFVFLAGGPERAFQSSDFLGGLPALIGLIFSIIVILPIGLLFFIPSIFLLKKKRKAWWFIEIILFIGIIVFLVLHIFPILIILLPPLILLLLDRKNFWKIAT